MRRMGDADHRRSQLLRGVLDLCLLAVIEEEAAYGYEMMKRLRSRGLSIVGEGSIYPLLGRLERDGLVSTYRAPARAGRRGSTTGLLRRVSGCWQKELRSGAQFVAQSITSCQRLKSR